MACIEIRYKDTAFKITNGDESDVFDTSDYALLYNFLTTGKLPTGFYVQGDSVDRETLFDYLCNNLVNSKDNNTLYIDSITNKSQNEFINKLIGNNSLDAVIGENLGSLENNVLVVNNWGDTKNWYGFTGHRMVMITGDKFYANKFATKSLLNAYALLRSNDKRTTNTINNLYTKYKDDKVNIYEKLTWLANHKLTELLANIYTPDNARYLPPKGKTINSILNNNISDVTGYYFKHLDDIYLIESKKDNNIINAKNILTNIISPIDTKSIKSIYKPINIYHGNSLYYLINGKWYNKKRSRFNILDIETSNKLFQEYFGVTDTQEERISTYNNNITGAYKIDDKPLIDQLQENSKVRTATGIYTKINNKFINGNEELDPVETIYDIYVNSDNDYNLVQRVKDLDIKDSVLSVSDLRLILYDHFNINDFSNVQFSYKKDSPTALVTTKTITTELGQLEAQPQLVLKYNISSNLDNYAEIALAVNYYNYLKTSKNIPSEISDVKKFWKELRDIVILNKNNPYKGTPVESIIETLSENVSVSINFLDQTLESNKQALSLNRDNSFVNELINKGLYIISCEL